MTEFWVSQAQHFCEHCKIFIANNNASKAIHENGVRHKENVAKRLADMRKRNITEKREKEAMEKDLERIEWKAKRQYEKDLEQQSASKSRLVFGQSSFQAATTTSACNTASGEGWVLDEKTGYYYDSKTKYTYDPNSGLYFSELTGRWTTQEEAVRASQEADVASSTSSAGNAAPELANVSNKQPNETMKVVSGSKNGATAKGTSHSRVPVATSQTKGVASPLAGSKGVASSLAVKRKRESDAPKAVTLEEANAIAAREAAKKRLEERTKKNYGFNF